MRLYNESRAQSVHMALAQVSGVPMLRKANMRKWGNDPAYLKYLDSTPLLWPFTNFLGLGAHLK